MDYHVPVMLRESSEFLISNPTGTYFDATLGFGGHSSEFLSLIDSNAKIVAVDKDIDAFENSKRKFVNEKRISIYNASFTEIKNISKLENIDGFDGIFADLGVSSYQLDNKSSGFTYRDEAELDLRMDKSIGRPAWHFINNTEESELASIFFKYGEEKKSRLIARKIMLERELHPIKSTTQLRNIIEAITPERFRNKTLSRIFQALRIYVNNELEELERFLNMSVDLLRKGGRIVILSYHSLEDRIVKEIFKYETKSCVCPPELPVCSCNKVSRLKILTKKPVLPTAIEIQANPRSRSAKLRAAERI
jgi:16S rRNA (cytosine1402-N4)-methyltransferase